MAQNQTKLYTQTILTDTLSQEHIGMLNVIFTWVILLLTPCVLYLTPYSLTKFLIVTAFLLLISIFYTNQQVRIFTGIIFTWITSHFVFRQLGLHQFYPANFFLTALILFYFAYKNKIKIHLGTDKIDMKRAGQAMYIGILYSIFIVFWFYAVGENIYSRRIPNLPIELLILAMLGFAFMNAISEEIIFRGVLSESLNKIVGKHANFVQAFWFGCLHYRSGFPNGVSGVILTFILGLHMYKVYKSTKGLFWPWIAHSIIDLSIIITVVLEKVE